MGLFDSLFGGAASDAANAAARDTYKKQKKATAEYNAVGDEYQNSLLGLSKAFQPYAQGGQSAFNQLLSGLGLSGDNGEAFTQAYHNTPGYQNGLDTGVRAVEGSANASHMLNSGKTLKGLYKFGSDYEDQRSNDYMSKLLGLTQLGQSATGQQVGTAAQGYGGRLQQRGTSYGGQMQSAGTIGQGMVAGANAEQSALTNLMGMGAYGIGAALGSPWLGTAMGFGAGAAKPQSTYMGPR